MDLFLISAGLNYARTSHKGVMWGAGTEQRVMVVIHGALNMSAGRKIIIKIEPIAWEAYRPQGSFLQV